MTPLHLDILRHYYITDRDYEVIPYNETRMQHAYYLVESGMLFTPRIDGKQQPLFKITNFGKKSLEQCLLTLEKCADG